MSVTRVDYARGVYVTYERMTPESDGYDAGQRWYYVVWTPEAGSVDSGYEVEDCGYAETKAEAVSFAREARERAGFRRSAVVKPIEARELDAAPSLAAEAAKAWNAAAELDPSATYAASLASADGRTERQFAIVSGETASKMLATSTTPARLRFRELASH
jgi:hypothetical protein